MSFILDDNDLINQLLKHGSDFENKFTKSGQVTSATVNANAALQQVLDNLESQLHPQPKDPNASEISTASGQPVSLTSAALESLGALVQWIAQAQITMNGQRIAYTQDQDPKNENYDFYHLEPAAGYLELADRTKVANGYFVNPELLVKYITATQALESKKPNDVLRVQLGKIITQANKLLGTKINSTYKEPEKQLADGQVLDSFPLAIDPKNYGADGPAQLTYGDIKSPEAFNAWMKSKGLTVSGKNIDSPEFNACAVIQTVHNKAKWRLSRSTTADLKSQNAIYVRQVEQVGPSIVGPDGKACALSGTTSQTAGAGTGGEAADGITRVLSVLPLRTDDIDFTRIKTFFEEYRKIMNQSRPDTASILNAMTNVENTSMPNATRMTENQMDTFPLAVDGTTLGTWLIPPKGQREAHSLIDNLRYVVTQTAAVVRHFKNSHQLTGPQQAAVIGQVGEDAESAGIAGVNLNHLDIWANQINSQPNPNAPSNTPPGWKARGY